jgi:hypothetical protein
MTGSLAWTGNSRLRASALAGSSAVFGILTVIAGVGLAIGQLTGNFGISPNDAALVVTLVGLGSVVFFWLFPYLIPVLGTIRLLLFYFGAAVVMGW